MDHAYLKTAGLRLVYPVLTPNEHDIHRPHAKSEGNHSNAPGIPPTDVQVHRTHTGISSSLLVMTKVPAHRSMALILTIRLHVTYARPNCHRPARMGPRTQGTPANYKGRTTKGKQGDREEQRRHFLARYDKHRSRKKPRVGSVE